MRNPSAPVPRAHLAGIAAAMLLVQCPGPGPEREVVVFVSVDRTHAEPILDRFERATGIDVRAVYDVEAAKTAGLVQRLVAERRRPVADVFWNGEPAQTTVLAARRLLAPYEAPSAGELPAELRDPQRRWTALGGRARVLLVNRTLVETDEMPRSLWDLATDRWPPEQVGIAYPFFGTSATHAAALFAALGAERARQLYHALRRRGVRVVDGNATVRDLVVGGQLAVGLTDTDDACGALQRGAPVTIVVPDQEPGQMGTLLVVGTVSLVAGAPHPEEARRLIDTLASSETERALVVSGFSQFPLRPVDVSSPCRLPRPGRRMQLPLSTVPAHFERARRELRPVFVR